MTSRWTIVLLLGTMLSLALAPFAGAAERRLPTSAADVQLSFAPLVKRVAPAVVNIYTRRVVEREVGSPLFDDPFFKQFFGDRFGFGGGRTVRRQQNALGSGVIVSSDGLVITNHHVIEGADEITVALSDRREFAGKLVLDDERTDLAVLRIDTHEHKLPWLQLGNSDDLEVGDIVLAIGNPFNVGQTVTSGIVSAVARTGLGISDYQFFIQTDAAINPGNSGGALVTLDGRLVGINTAIFSRTGGSLGIGFAIPSSMARVVLDSAVAGLDYVQRPWLGAATQPVTAEIATSLSLSRPVGALVRKVYPKGPADKADIRVGDVIVSVDGHEIDDPQALGYRLGTKLIGGKLGLGLIRNGRTLQRELSLEKPPERPPREVTVLQGDSPLAGAKVANLSPALAEELGVDSMSRGVIVLEVARGSPAQRLKLQPGDMVLKVNGDAIDDVDNLKHAVAETRSKWELSVRRDDRTLNVVIRG